MNTAELKVTEVRAGHLLRNVQGDSIVVGCDVKATDNRTTLTFSCEQDEAPQIGDTVHVVVMVERS